mgnify:FL=1
MGIADLVPGISGGTFAFIMGIYERLIYAITKINIENSKEFLLLLKKRNFKEFWNKFKELDFLFLFILFLGIFSSIIFMSKVIHYLYETYTSFLLVFFIGLILGSIKIIYDDIPKHKLFNYMFGFGGFLLGISLLYLKELTQINPSFLMIFFSGFLAVTALFLPGISGSFILLILGMYSFMLDILQNIFSNLLSLGVFMLGALFGMIIISKTIYYLFSQDKSKTLYVLLGFVIGSLGILVRDSLPGISLDNYMIHIGLGVFASIIVLTLSFISRGKK